MSVHESLAVAVALAASGFDLRSRRIPNALTLGGALAGLIASAVAAGMGGVWYSAAGWALATAMWLPLYALGGMGAGDVKLIAAIGAWLGPLAIFYTALYSAVAGAVMAAGIVVAHGCARQTYVNIQLLLTHWRVAGFTPYAQLTLETAHSPRLAYAIPILVGTVAAIWLH